MSRLTTLRDGLVFGEGPRWHAGRLFVSDMHADQVLAIDADGSAEVICEVAQQPSGLGWLPDGRMLVVSMTDRRVLRHEADGSLVEHANLFDLASFHCNDMVVAADGGAYVGNFGFDLDGGGKPCMTNLVYVAPDGSAREVADDLGFPNGMVITPDGTTLVVGESWRGRLTAFPILADGTLGERRLWAQLDGAVPDGICLDADGAIWVACPMSNRVLRIAEGGAVLDEIPTGRPAYAVMLGGDDGCTLHVCTGDGSHPETIRNRPPTAAVEIARVAVPHAGRP